MSASVEYFLSAIQSSRFWPKHDVENFFQAKSALPVDRVESLGPVYDVPLDLIGLDLLLQVPYVITKGCAVPLTYFVECCVASFIYC